MDRRTFLKIVSLGSLSVAAGCTPDDKTIYSLVEAPDDMVTGKATWYASTCRECPAGCGILAKNREGRIIKLEGNPLHPISRGKLCMRGQSALQGIYNPDRITIPQLKEQGRWRTISFSQALMILTSRAQEASKSGKNRVRMITEIAGDPLLSLFSSTLGQWQSEPPLIYEPFAYESLKAANGKTFGVEGLPSYRMEKADMLVSFGADFVETWLSPVEYARKFKTMHALRDGEKGLFFHVSPYQSLTAANADQWLSCKPSSEASVALGLIHEALKRGKGRGLDEALRNSLVHIASPYNQERVIHLSGIEPGSYKNIMSALFASQRPLILGTGNDVGCASALQTDIAANLLNLILDQKLTLFDFQHRHRIEAAGGIADVLAFFDMLKANPADLLLLNNVNPVYSLPPEIALEEALNTETLFVVSFSDFMDETTRMADLIIPVRLPLETWDEYGGKHGLVSTLQPAMGRLTEAPLLGDVLLQAAFGGKTRNETYQKFLLEFLAQNKNITSQKDWVETIQHGGRFGGAHEDAALKAFASQPIDSAELRALFGDASAPSPAELHFRAVPSIRFFDGRGANKPWLCEVPDTLTQVAWFTPVVMHPLALAARGLRHGDVVRVETKQGRLEGSVYESEGVNPQVVAVTIGQGHDSYGRYAQGVGLNPLCLFSVTGHPTPSLTAGPVSIIRTGRTAALPHTDGSRFQHGRPIALSVKYGEIAAEAPLRHQGLTMEDFPLTLPLPEGYSLKRDMYPPHEHEGYRWGMVIDLERCIGCSACALACYAENNLGVVGPERIIEGREMAWLQVQRYLDPQDMKKVTFLPMLCQHCDNAPCESVCPVYAPHHSKEGLNNQIYNRCIGTRFCSQNCPYKVRRFNWFTWEWPKPLNLQLNPDVTVRSKGVMEKCSFCVQRIKVAHGVAKDEGRTLQDGDVIPACVQTCPTDALVFGNLMDENSRVRKLVQDRRAFQVMGYLNTKPAVIYLKKVII